MFWGMFDILSVSPASQYYPYVLEHLGKVKLTNAAPSTSLSSTSGGSKEGSTTLYKQANKSNFVLHCVHLYNWRLDKDGFNEQKSC